MTTKTKKFGSLAEFTRTHQLNPNLVQAVTGSLAYAKANFKQVFTSEFIEKANCAVNYFLGDDLNTLIKHPFNTSRLTISEQVLNQDNSFFESDRGVALLRHFRNEFEIIHKLNTIKLMFSMGAKLKGETDVKFALNRAESVIANEMLHSFEVLSRHMNILKDSDGNLKLGKNSIYLLINELKLDPKDYVDEIKEHFGESGQYFIAEINLLLVDLALHHAVST